MFDDSTFEKLQNSKVIIFGLGGVGGYVFESLIRTGIQNIDIVDFDTVNPTNINRQIIANKNTIGQYKVDLLKSRALKINENVKIGIFKTFFSEENKGEFDFHRYDYVVDAIDSLKSKIELIVKAKEENVPIISSMGAGFKMEPDKVEISDIYKTSYCPLAKVLRNELKKRGIKDLKVVFSKEKPIKTKDDTDGIIASAIFVPATFGLTIASEVVKDLTHTD